MPKITLANGESQIYCSSSSSSQQNEIDDAAFYNISVQLQYPYLDMPGCIKIEILNIKVDKTHEIIFQIPYVDS